MSRRGLRFPSLQGMPASMRAAAAATLETDVATGKPKASKYGNVRTVVDGITFDSKREAEHYVALKAMRAAGAVLWFTRQVPFYLPGKTKYVADFVVAFADGRAEVQDVKSEGTKTAIYNMKRKQVREIHNVEIVEI